ncbi:MAG: CPBP family intramembrane metalloprotease [bacterium]|nr:CPBP family intramembrane metalloprotease [bacterium]
MLTEERKSKDNWLLLVILFLVGGSLVVLVSMTYDSLIPVRVSIALRSSLIALFFGMDYMLRNRSDALPFRRMFQALLAATVGLFLSWYSSPHFQDWLGYSTNTPMGIALAKLVSAVCIVVPVLLITRYFGFKWTDLSLGTGRLRLTMIIGVIGFLSMVGLAIVHPSNQSVPLAQVVPLLPSIFIFIFANAFMEELLFRGLFLKQLEVVAGKGLAILSTSLVFTAGHLTVTYTPDLLFFLGILFVLAVIWAWVMQKTESIIGPTLFHAGADVIIVLGVFHSMGVSLGG